MSKTAAGGGKKRATKTQKAAGAENPILGDPKVKQYWKDRLREAREKRDLVLSGRTSADQPGVDRDCADNEKPVSENTGKQKRPSMFGELLSGSNALKMALTFFAAAGAGLGVTLGIGILLIWSAFGTTQAADTTQHNVVAAEVLLATPPVQESPQDVQVVEAAHNPPTIVTAELIAPLDVWIAPDFDTTPAPTVLDSVSLPEMATYQYAMVDVSLPQLSEKTPTSFGSVTYSGSTELVVSNRGGPKFFIHAPDGLSDAKVRGYLEQINGAGVSVAAIGREKVRVSTTHLRYYSPETADAAMEIARGLDVEARDFSGVARNSSRIEVWVAGRPKQTAQVTKTDNSRKRPHRFFGRSSDRTN